MSTDNQFPLWEVFVQSKSGTPHKHAGSVHAADKEMALQNARDLYTRRSEGTNIWVVPAAQITALIDRRLIMIDRVQNTEVLIFSRATGRQEPGRGELYRRGQKLAENVMHLAGVNVLGLERGKDLVVESGAVRA